MNSIYYICKNRVNLFQDGTVVVKYHIIIIYFLPTPLTKTDYNYHKICILHIYLIIRPFFKYL